MVALGNKADQKHDDEYRVSQAARTLGRIVQLARETVPNATLTSLIEPQHFDLMVDVAKKLSTDKETPALNVCRTIGTLLTKVSMSKYCLALHSNDYEAQRNASGVCQESGSETLGPDWIGNALVTSNIVCSSCGSSFVTKSGHYEHQQRMHAGDCHSSLAIGRRSGK